jgi:hypothetical protein
MPFASFFRLSKCLCSRQDGTVGCSRVSSCLVLKHKTSLKKSLESNALAYFVATPKTTKKFYDRQTDRRIDRQTDRHTDIHLYVVLCVKHSHSVPQLVTGSSLLTFVRVYLWSCNFTHPPPPFFYELVIFVMGFQKANVL